MHLHILAEQRCTGRFDSSSICSFHMQANLCTETHTRNLFMTWCVPSINTGFNSAFQVWMEFIKANGIGIKIRTTKGQEFHIYRSQLFDNLNVLFFKNIWAFIHFPLLKVLIFSVMNVMAVRNATYIMTPTTNASSDGLLDFKATFKLSFGLKTRKSLKLFMYQNKNPHLTCRNIVGRIEVCGIYVP